MAGASCGAPTAPAIADFREANAARIAFHAWLQWRLDAQLARAAEEIAIVNDLPIGLDVAGADAWCWQDLMARDVSVGAPARRVQRRRPGLGPDAVHPPQACAPPATSRSSRRSAGCSATSAACASTT